MIFVYYLVIILLTFTFVFRRIGCTRFSESTTKVAKGKLPRNRRTLTPPRVNVVRDEALKSTVQKN